MSENNLRQVMNSSTISKVSINQDVKSINAYFETCNHANKIKQTLKMAICGLSSRKELVSSYNEVR